MTPVQEGPLNPGRPFRRYDRSGGKLTRVAYRDRKLTVCATLVRRYDRSDGSDALSSGNAGVFRRDPASWKKNTSPCV
jgi:hypothetical protein